MVSGRVIMKKLTRLWSDESGASAIELGLISVAILVPLLLGSTELGRRIWVKSQLDNAVRVGMEYIMANNQTSPAGSNIQNAVQSATPLASAVTMATAQPCGGTAYYCYGCPTSSGVTLGGTSSTTCSSGGTAGRYAGLKVDYSYTPLFYACGNLLPDVLCPLTSAATVWSSSEFTRIQ